MDGSFGLSSQHWHLWQLADSAFPTGGFAHSAGLEAALAQGEIQGVAEFEGFLGESLWQAGHGALPLANGSHADTSELGRLDGLCDLFLNNPVANRSSRVQGRTFLSTCLRSLGGGVASGESGEGELERLGARIKGEKLHHHYAPVFGAVMRVLGVERELMQRLFLYGSARGVISAAVRLGVLGPYQAQSVQWRLASHLEEVLLQCGSFGASELAQSAPLLDLLQSNHDRLYSRLFQS